MDGAVGPSGEPRVGDDMRALGYREVRRWVIDINAPGMRERIDDAVHRINASEEEAHILAEIEANTAEVWRLIPE